MLSEPEIVEGCLVGETVEREAKDLSKYGYVLASDNVLSKKLQRDAAENVIIFYYTRALTGYEVRYIDDWTGEDILPPDYRPDFGFVGEVIAVFAPPIADYRLVSLDEQCLQLSMNEDYNVIYFYYELWPILM